MTRLRRRFVSAFVACGVAFSARSASAQGWLADRKYTEGPGIRLGDLELHLGLGGELGYDSNWFLRSLKTGYANSEPAVPVRGAGVLRLTPSFAISTLSAQRLEDGGQQRGPSPFAFRVGGSATYREFLIGADELNDQRNVAINLSGRVDVNPGGVIGAGVFAAYNRTIQPSVLGNPDLSFNRDDIAAGAEVIVIPGGGALDLRAQYQATASLFEDTLGVPYSSFTHTISERNRWRFRPRTALFHDTSIAFVSYPDAGRATQYLDDSTPIRTNVGITGLVTERIGVTGSVGYGATFFKNTAVETQYDSFTATAEGTYYLAATPGGTEEPGKISAVLSTLSLGYTRDFQRSLLANFYSSNKGYLKFRYLLGGRAVIDFLAEVEALDYPAPFVNGPGGTPTAALGLTGAPIGDFTNWRVGAGIFGEYRLSNIFGINTSIDYAQMISDTVIPAGGNVAPGTAAAGALQNFYDLNWRRLQVFVGARVLF